MTEQTEAEAKRETSENKRVATAEQTEAEAKRDTSENKNVATAEQTPFKRETQHTAVVTPDAATPPDTVTPQPGPVEADDDEAQQAMPEVYFLVQPENTAFVTGEGERRLPPSGALVVLMALLLPLGLGVWLAYTAYMRWTVILPALQAGLAQPPDTLANGIAWTGAAVLVLLVALGLYGSALAVAGAQHALAKRGELVWGVLTSASARLDGSDTFRLTVEYRFKEPKRWHIIRRRTIEGRVKTARNDLKGQPLPPPGTPIPVLYLSPNNYEVL